MIVLFTKNRPEFARHAAEGISKIDVPKYLLDDSSSHAARLQNRAIAAELGLVYHGDREQGMLLPASGKPSCLSVLGDARFTLGKCRNYAVYLARQVGEDRLIMMDDDISAVDRSNVDYILRQLSTKVAVGSRIRGMPDQSLTGHLAMAGGWSPPDFPSGAFLGINANKFRELFLNVYNEDWIAVINSGAAGVELHGEVIQRTYNPLERVRRCCFEEVGEVVVEGLLIRRSDQTLSSVELWEEALAIRRARLRALSAMDLPAEASSARSKTLERLERFHAGATAHHFAGLMRAYERQRGEFHTLLGTHAT